LAFGKEGLAIQFRRICGHCLPCPTKIAVSDVLCLELNARHYGLKDRAKQQYGRQRVKADSCTKCGECTEKCPHGLPAMDLALRAGSTFA
jgi:predicted aldo/keto reductase-like oxidoreductase